MLFPREHNLPWRAQVGFALLEEKMTVGVDQQSAGSRLQSWAAARCEACLGT
jgi:hypothetical protein